MSYCRHQRSSETGKARSTAVKRSQSVGDQSANTERRSSEQIVAERRVKSENVTIVWRSVSENFCRVYTDFIAIVGEVSRTREIVSGRNKSFH